MLSTRFINLNKVGTAHAIPLTFLIPSAMILRPDGREEMMYNECKIKDFPNREGYFHAHPAG
jgi:hypothetical protein